MKYEKKHLKRYRIAKKELASLKYILGFAVFLSLLQAFGLTIPGTNGRYVEVLGPVFLILSAQYFFSSQYFFSAPDNVLSNMVDAAINSDPDNIKNLSDN